MKKNQSSAAIKPTPTELLVRCQSLLGQPVDSEQLMELVMQLLAQELIAAKLQGKAISDNLKLWLPHALRQPEATCRRPTLA